MDSTHITYGVLTTGYIWKDLKLEIAVFQSRDSVTDTVWFYNPLGSFFRTRAVRLENILSVQETQTH